MQNGPIDSSFITENIGQPTFKSKANGGEYAPDATVHHTSNTNNIHWRVGKDIGSDHLPSIFDVKLIGKAIRRRGNSKWSYKKADCKNFQGNVNDQLHQMEMKDNDAITQ